MLGFLYRLFIGNFKSCNHFWIVESRSNILRISNDPKLHNTIKGSEYIMRCKHCGDIKSEYFPVN